MSCLRLVTMEQKTKLGMQLSGTTSSDLYRAFKTAQMVPLLKKPGLDKEQRSSYWLIWNLMTV